MNVLEKIKDIEQKHANETGGPGPAYHPMYRKCAERSPQIKAFKKFKNIYGKLRCERGFDER